jgi:hypothetical protein
MHTLSQYSSNKENKDISRMDALKLYYSDKENLENGKEPLRKRFEDLLAKTKMMQVTERMGLHVRVKLVYKRNC